MEKLKLKWWAWVVIALTLAFIIGRFILESYLKNGTTLPLGSEKNTYMEKFKKMIETNKIIKKQACENIDNELKLKKDLEGKLESLFKKYSSF